MVKRFCDWQRAGTSLQTMAIGFVVVIAAGLRFYKLDTPSMWLDEILVPMAASHPLEYIFDLCRNAEVHPPGYYIVVKLIMFSGVSDFALRILSAVCGVSAVWLTFIWIGELSDRRIGILGAALLAINPLHVYDSRVVRPYALFLAITLFGLIWLFRFLRNLDEKYLWKFFAANATLLLLHYSSVILAGAFGLVLFYAWLTRPSKQGLKTIYLFMATSAAAFSLNLPFFLGRIENTHKAQFMGYDFFDATLNTLGKLSEVFFLHKEWPIRILIALAVLSGGGWLAKRGGLQGRSVLILFLPLLARSCSQNTTTMRTMSGICHFCCQWQYV